MDIYKIVLESKVSDTLRQIIDDFSEEKGTDSLVLLLAIYKQIGDIKIYTEALKVLEEEDVSLEHLVGTAKSSILLNNYVEAINYCYKRGFCMMEGDRVFRIESILNYSALVCELINIQESDNVVNETAFPLVFSSCVGYGNMWDLLEQILCDVNCVSPKGTVTDMPPKELFLSTFSFNIGERALTEKTFLHYINERLSFVDEQGFLVIFTDKINNLVIADSLLHCRDLSHVIETDITIIIIKKHKNNADFDIQPLNKDISNVCSAATFVNGMCFFDNNYVFDYKPLLGVCKSKDARYCCNMADFLSEFYKSIEGDSSIDSLNNLEILEFFDLAKKELNITNPTILSQFICGLVSPSFMLSYLTQFLRPLNSLGVPLLGLVQSIDVLPINDVCNFLIQEKSELVGKKITFAALSSKFYDCDVNEQTLPLTQCQGRIISKPCLLVSAVNGVTRIGRVSSLPETPLCVDDDVEMFEIKSQDITEEYLLYQLSLAPLTKWYFDHLNGYIYLPSLDVQHNVVNRVKSRLISNHEQELKEQYEAYKKEIREIKHNIGQDTSYILNLFKTLIKKIENNPTAVDPEFKIGRDNPVTLKEYLEKGREKLKVIDIKLETLTMSESDKYAPTFLSLNEFLLSYIDKNQTPNYRIEYHDNLSPRLKDIDIQKGNEVKQTITIDNVWCNNNALERILSNIITNAEKYGFRNSRKDINIVAIDTYLSGTDFVVEIANNGEPLDSSMDKERCFEYGESTGKASGIGTGLGLYDTRKLMERYGGTIKMLSDTENEFPVTLRLEFKKNQLTMK